jgi:beta-glucanase (GH16 family)
LTSSGCGSSPNGIVPPRDVQKFSLSGTISPASGGSGSAVNLTGAASATTTADNSGNFSFANLANGSYTLTPSKTGFAFSPPSLPASIAGANISGLNFAASASSPGPSTVFFDDFNETTLSSSWTAVDRAGDGGEFQCNKPANNVVSGGYLVITAQSQSPAISCGTSTVQPMAYSFTSGMVMWSSFSFTYGKVEIRMQLPSSCIGCRPVVWLLGSDCQSTTPATPDNTGTCNWPFPGSEEIDIAEFIGSNYGQVNQFLHASGGDHGGPFNFDVNSGYHVYEMIWSPGQISFTIDGKPTQTITAADVPSKPMFLIVEDTMEGSGCPSGGPTCNVIGVPTTMSIDYVKITQP